MIVTKQMNRKGFIESLRLIDGKISKCFKVLMPYMSLIAVILCLETVGLSLINLVYLNKIQSDVQNLQYSVDNIKIDYDNSDVINAIEDAEGNIIGSVEDAENNIRRNLIIWGN